MSSYWESITRTRVARRTALKSVAGASLSAAVLSLIGCGSDSGSKSSESKGNASGLVTKPVDSTSKAVKGGVIRGIQNADSSGFNAYPTTELTVTTHNGFAYSKFFTMSLANRAKDESPTATVVGDILQSFEFSPDGLTLTGKLRPNAAFDPRPPTNGRAVEGKDILYSWNKIKALGKTKGQLSAEVNPSAPIQSVTMPDATTVVFKLNSPSPSLLPNLAYDLNGNFIYPVEAEDKFDPRAQMRGSGAWLLDDYKPSVSFSYRRNPKFYKSDRPWLDGLDYSIISEYASQLSQFRTGNIYTMPVKPEDIIGTKKELPGVVMQSLPYSTAVVNPAFFSFLPNSPWIDDRLRLALSMSIDRELLTSTIFNADGFSKEGIDVALKWNSFVGVGEAEYWLDPKSSDYGDNAKYFKHNIAEATKLVQAATGQSKFSSTLNYPNPPTYGTAYQQGVQVTKNMLEEGPFVFKNNGVDYATVFSKTISGSTRVTGGHSFDGVAVAGVAEFPEADSWFSGHLLPGGPFYKFEENYPATNDQLYTLIKAQQAEQDHKKRVEIVKDLQRYMASKMYIVPTLGATLSFQLGWGWVGNFGTFAGRGGVAGLTELWLDKTKQA